MWKVEAAYIRARHRRNIITIICTTCACSILGLVTVSPATVILGGTLTAIITWFTTSQEVDKLYKIHVLGGSYARHNKDN